MKLSEKQIERMAAAVIHGLMEGGFAVPKGDRAGVEGAVREVIAADLQAEEDLDREVERLLAPHTGRLDAEGADYRKMFALLKQKLARERGIVL
jgi:hypothetical protein